MEELCDFFPAKNRWQAMCLFRIRSIGKTPGSPECLDVEKTQCCQTSPYRARRFSFPKQLRLIFANVSRTQAIRGTVEASSKIFHCANVVAYGILCVITKLSFRAIRPAKPDEKPREAATSFQWVSLFFRAWSSSSIIFLRWVTGTPPVTHTYIQAIKQPTLHYLTRSVRRRAATSKRANRKLCRRRVNRLEAIYKIGSTLY